MADDRWQKKRIINSDYAYRVFSEIIKQEEGSYATEVNEKIEKYDRQEASRVISKMKEIGLLKEGKRGKAKYYVVDPEGLSDLFSDIWNIESKVPSEDFQDFLFRYVELYDKGDSSIRKMLREDFAEAAVSYQREHGSWPEGLQFLDEVPGLEGFVPVQDYFERAVEDIFEG